ncbi:MAG: extracellular solute-binding protein, partial [Limnochordia bacterium]|nr:extracellular solute-binding protein [Limnochordia bacterium]
MKKGTYTWLVLLVVGVTLTFVPALNAQTIVHWEHFNEGLAEMTDKLAREYEASHPGVTVEYNPMPYANYWERILISLETGTGPDVFKLPYGNAREFYLQGLLAPIPESIMTNEEMEATFVPWTIEDFKFDDQYYASPIDIQMMLLFVNNELFEEAGLEVRQPKDWDEVVEWAKILTKYDENGRMTQLGLDVSPRRAVYKTLMMQYLDPVTVIDP